MIYEQQIFISPKTSINVLIAILIVLLTNGCRQRAASDTDYSNAIYQVNRYSKGFSISSVDGGNILTVTNPWQEASSIKYSYFLSKEINRNSEANFSENIFVPANRIICLSTTHIAFLDKLGCGERIVGVSGEQYVNSNIVQQRVEEGLVKDVGFEQALNYELIVSLKPDIVFAYGVGAEMAGYLQKLKDLRIPVVFIGDYLEENPLGKAEWIKVFGLFTGRDSLANQIFNSIVDEYNKSKLLVSEITDKPNVFINIPWKDVWYFPGGQGYMATLIGDAGGEYLLSHLADSRSYPFSIENALEFASKAQVWINTGSVNSIAEIANNIPIAKGLPIMAGGRIYNNNNRLNITGGNDFWESGVVNPHLILKDLIKIFHPNTIEHNLVYYKKME